MFRMCTVGPMSQQHVALVYYVYINLAMGATLDTDIDLSSTERGTEQEPMEWWTHNIHLLYRKTVSTSVD